MLRLNECLQIRELRSPEHAVGLQPLVHDLEPLRVEFIKMLAPLPALVDKVRSQEDAKVLGNGWPRDWKRLCDPTGRMTAPTEQIEHGPASRISQGLERTIRSMRNRLSGFFARA